MKIQYMSDLHLEFAANRDYVEAMHIPVMGEILVLAGDTFNINNVQRHNEFLQWASDNYRQVIIVPGNHEFYGGADVLNRGMNWEWKILPNVGIYQNKVLHIDDTDFILSTLWSQIKPQEEYMVWRALSDFRQTYYGKELITTEQYNRLHQYCLAFIKQSVVSSTASRIVVVTHHLPTTLVVAPRHASSPINSAFATELGEYIADSAIDVWIYGHSHTNIDATIGTTRIVSNQLGYVSHNEHIAGRFSPDKFITI